MRRRGFSLIELLVVIAIIALLVGLLLAGVGPLRESLKRSRTQAILGAAQQALAIRSAEKGGAVSPAEHPAAASAEPRRRFVRAGDHSPVATTGLALAGVEPAALPLALRPRLLLDDDLCADADLPVFYGLPRRRLGVLGSAISGITARKILAVGPDYALPANHPDLPGVGRLAETSADLAETRRLMELFLGGPVLAELAKLKALHQPEADAPLCADGRLWSASDAGVVAGTFRVPSGGRLHAYRLRSLALYDAWGNELLYWLGEAEAPCFASAGRDGYFRFDPLADGLQSEPWAAEAAAGDRDAQRDNLIAGRE